MSFNHEPTPQDQLHVDAFIMSALAGAQEAVDREALDIEVQRFGAVVISHAEQITKQADNYRSEVTLMGEDIYHDGGFDEGIADDATEFLRMEPLKDLSPEAQERARRIMDGENVGSYNLNTQRSSIFQQMQDAFEGATPEQRERIQKIYMSLSDKPNVDNDKQK